MIQYATLGAFLAAGGFWAEVQTAAGPDPFPFIVEKTPETLDTMTDFKYGQRWMNEKAAGKTHAQLAALVVALHGDKWRQLIAIQAQNIDVSARDIRTRDEEVEKTDTGNRMGETLNKVSAYNEEDLSTESGNTNTEESEATTNSTAKITEKVSDLKTAFENLSTLQKMDIIATATKDVVSTLTLSTY